MLIILSLFLLFVITTVLSLFRGFLYSIRDTFRSVFGRKSRKDGKEDPEVKYMKDKDGGRKRRKKNAFKSEGEYVDYEDV